MTKSIVVTYDEADESFLLTLLQRIKVKTSVFEPKTEGMNAFMTNKARENDVNRLEILAATKELDNRKQIEIIYSLLKKPFRSVETAFLVKILRGSFLSLKTNANPYPAVTMQAARFKFFGDKSLCILKI